MSGEVLLTITGTQAELGAPLSSGAVTEVITTAQYREKDGTMYLFYEECAENPDKPVKCRMTIKPSCVEIRRHGLRDNVMEFAMSRHTQTEYPTPYGVLVLGFKTRFIGCEKGNGYTRVTIDYILDQNGVALSRNVTEVKIEFKA